jgi:hypothetical protein
MDDSFEDVSAIGKYSDILASIDGASSSVLIEVKNYQNNIPSSEVDKFWRDMERRDAKYGVFISMRTKIAHISSCISMKNNMERTGIFVINSDLNDQGHLFAFYVIKKLIELEALKKKEISTEAFEKCMNSINDKLLDIQKMSESLDQIERIADGLKTRTSRDLDKIGATVRTLKRKLNEEIDLACQEIRSISV